MINTAAFDFSTVGVIINCSTRAIINILPDKNSHHKYKIVAKQNKN